MVSFMCQLEWAKGCPESWQVVVSGCVCEGVSDEIHIWVHRLAIDIFLTNVGGYHSVCWGPEQNKMVEGGWNCSLSWAGTSICCLWTSAFLVLGPSDLDWNYATSFPGPPACWWHIMGFLSLHYFVSLYLIINKQTPVGSVSLGEL